ncbi:DUF1772 domain-containing protein [Phytomonospora endophytica]|uniref:Putative membrane protein n=1 Tax=Phytomonospora endophytica TaxID=714109 RepID=A0A841FE26_9ACTN|nr:DUF1772 domain-containing protein [Phytomonospora endophytica]MBB6034516.1 putative membrane protein [Phytomonospora endophytica]GIG70424.1 hypothetical protein Pen01_67190 [Phytomonospora endophytica]
MLVRYVKALALLSSGLLAGAFMYGATNVAPTFRAVPLDVRLTFHTALMRMNGPVMQTLMGLTFVTAVALAVLSRGRTRLIAAGAGVLALVSFVVTRFGNVPINTRIKVWAVEGAPADHAEILARWDAFNYVRTAAGILAFGLLIWIALRRPSTQD